MKSKKILSLLLALMMMLSVVPFYASAEAVALTRDNVTQWPTVSYKTADGKMYYGQTVGEALTINDDEIVTDANGNVVAGHFELIDPDEIPNGVSSSMRASLKFIPDDETSYTGFEYARCRYVTYSIEKGTLKLVDEINDLPVATGEYPSGTAITDIAITGGAVVNVLSDAERANRYIIDWTWQDTSLKITESGYYNAVRRGDYFENEIVIPIYITIESNVAIPTITESPTATITYGQIYADATLSGGKVMAGETEVSGTFALKNASTSVPNAGIYTPAVIFTPDDLEKYTTCEGTATITVNPAPIKFVDENGAECVPEITVPYGTKLGDKTSGAGNSLRQYLSQLDGILYSFAFYDLEGNKLESTTVVPVGTTEYKVLVAPQSDNYEATELTFKLTVEATDVKVNIFALTDTIQVRKANSNDPTPTGTFAIYVDGVLLKDGVKENTPVEWNPTVSKTYEIKAVYTPAENDPVNVEDVTISAEKKLERKITYGDLILNGNPSYYYGDTVSLKANASAENFEGWVITDAAGNEVNLGVDLTALNITFTMPDYDLNIEAKVKSTSSGGLDIDNIFGGLDMDELMQGDSECWFINLLRNIIAKMGAFIEDLKGTFRSIGDIS